MLPLGSLRSLGTPFGSLRSLMVLDLCVGEASRMVEARGLEPLISCVQDTTRKGASPPSNC
jgi:hypothetical protein